MGNNRREAVLKIAVGAVVALFLLDRAVLTPAATHWKEQGARIAGLRQKVERGRQLLERGESIRGRSAEMTAANLPEDSSAAEEKIIKAIGRWTRESGLSFSSLVFPSQWQPHEEGFDTFECRASTAGDQAALGRLLYEIETDPLPVRLEECEISARDAKGKQLTLTARFTFLRLKETGGTAR